MVSYFREFSEALVDKLTSKLYPMQLGKVWRRGGWGLGVGG